LQRFEEARRVTGGEKEVLSSLGGRERYFSQESVVHKKPRGKASGGRGGEGEKYLRNESPTE